MKRKTKSQLRPGERFISRCNTWGCSKISKYMWPYCGSTKCSSHREPGMVTRRVIICSYKNCKNTAFFSKPGGIPKRCESHAKSSYENVVFTQCSICNTSSMRVHMFDGVCITCMYKSDAVESKSGKAKVEEEAEAEGYEPDDDSKNYFDFSADSNGSFNSDDEEFMTRVLTNNPERSDWLQLSRSSVNPEIKYDSDIGDTEFLRLCPRISHLVSDENRIIGSCTIIGSMIIGNAIPEQMRNFRV